MRLLRWPQAKTSVLTYKEIRTHKGKQTSAYTGERPSEEAAKVGQLQVKETGSEETSLDQHLDLGLPASSRAVRRYISVAETALVFCYGGPEETAVWGCRVLGLVSIQEPGGALWDSVSVLDPWSQRGA